MGVYNGLEFIAIKNGKRVKIFRAKHMSTIYAQFNRYCNKRGYTHSVSCSYSFGGMAWSDTHNMLTLYPLKQYPEAALNKEQKISL